MPRVSVLKTTTSGRHNYMGGLTGAHRIKPGGGGGGNHDFLFASNNLFDLICMRKDRDREEK